MKHNETTKGYGEIVWGQYHFDALGCPLSSTAASSLSCASNANAWCWPAQPLALSSSPCPSRFWTNAGFLERCRCAVQNNCGLKTIGCRLLVHRIVGEVHHPARDMGLALPIYIYIYIFLTGSCAFSLSLSFSPPPGLQSLNWLRVQLGSKTHQPFTVHIDLERIIPSSEAKQIRCMARLDWFLLLHNSALHDRTTT